MTTTIFKGNSPVIASDDELEWYFQRGEKPREAWRIGTEHEKLGFATASRQPLAYDGAPGILALLEALRTRFGWNPVCEGEHLIALSRDNSSISLEPGGQFELSGAPVESAHGTCAELNAHLNEVRAVSEELGITWFALARNPFVPSNAMPWMPKERYGIMRSYLPTRGSMARDMMLGTATVQTNIDYSDEADMGRKMRLGLYASPFFTAMFANSPIAEGKPTGFLSQRGQIWMHTDNDRSSFIPAALEPGFLYQDYVQYALDVPMFFIYREGHYVDYSGRSFREYLERGMDGHVATHEDWELHLTTLFPPMRLKNFLELRMVDVGPVEMICALSALTRGLFYDDRALAEAQALLDPLVPAEIPALQAEAARSGLRAEAQGRPLQSWCADLLQIATAGLNRLDTKDAQGRNETFFLAPLERIVSSGKTCADRLLDLYEGPWKRSLDPLYQSEFVI